MILNVICVVASDQDQNGDSPFMVNDGNIIQDKTLVLFPDDETEGDSEIQNEFSGGISSQDGTKSFTTTAATTTTTEATTTTATTTITTTTTTTASTTTTATTTATTTTARTTTTRTTTATTTTARTTTTTTTARTSSEIPIEEIQSELPLNDDLEIDLDDPDNSDLAGDYSEGNLLVKDNTGSDGGPIDNIYDLLEPDQQDNSQKDSSSEEPLYDIIDTNRDPETTESGSGSQEPSEGDPQVDADSGSVQLIAIIVGVVIVLLIIATSIFMIRRKRASSHKATYNIATVEQATRKPREAHI